MPLVEYKEDRVLDNSLSEQKLTNNAVIKDPEKPVHKQFDQTTLSHW